MNAPTGYRRTSLPSPEMTALLILEELRQMRKDLNEGIYKLHREIIHMNSATKVFNSEEDLIAKEHTFHLPYEVSVSESHRAEQHWESMGSVERGESSKTQDREFFLESTADSSAEERCDQQSDADALLGCKLSTGELGAVERSSTIDKICEKIRIKQETSPTTAFEHTTMPESSNVCSQSLPECLAANDETSAELNSTRAPLSSPNDDDDSGRRESPTYSNQLLAGRSNAVSAASKAYKMKNTCSICAHNFTSNHKLRKHYIEIHNYVNKHVCTFCGRSCYNSTELRVHIRIHTGEKPFKCAVCEKAFADRSNYMRHCRKRKNLICSICQKVLCNTMQLHQHNVTHDFKNILLPKA